MKQPIDAATAFAWFTTPRRLPDPPEAAALQAEATRLSLDFEDETLAVWHWGQGADRPIALLVHGWEGAAAQFHRLVPVLLAAGYRVVAPDMPAHGASTGRQSDPVAFGRAATAIGSALTAGRLGPQAAPVDTFIGHSVGSAAGLFAFAQGLQVNHSLHLAGPASLSRAVDRFARVLGLTPEVAAAFRGLLPRITGPQTDAMELEAQLHGLRHPALLLHDPADRIVPYAESETLAAAWPQAELRPLPGGGHAGFLEDERLLPAIRAFLPRLAAAA
ncbi:MAG: alpha/beta fold hydrolase [Sneathiellaceae bacterium]